MTGTDLLENDPTLVIDSNTFIVIVIVIYVCIILMRIGLKKECGQDPICRHNSFLLDWYIAGPTWNHKFYCGWR